MYEDVDRKVNEENEKGRREETTVNENGRRQRREWRNAREKLYGGEMRHKKKIV